MRNRFVCYVLAAMMAVPLQSCVLPIVIELKAEAEILGKRVKGELKIRAGRPYADLPENCEQIGSAPWRGRTVRVYECGDEFWICIPGNARPYRQVLSDLPAEVQEIIDRSRASSPASHAAGGDAPDPRPLLAPSSRPVPLGSHVFQFDTEAELASGSITLPIWATWKELPEEISLDVDILIEEFPGGSRVTLDGTINGVAGAMAYNGVRSFQTRDPKLGYVEGLFDADWGAWVIDIDGEPFAEWFVYSEEL